MFKDVMNKIKQKKNKNSVDNKRNDGNVYIPPEIEVIQRKHDVDENQK